MADVNIKIEIKNKAQIKAAFNQAPSIMRRNLNVAIRKSFVSIERDSRINTPVDTGRLRSSHRTFFRDMYGELSTNVFYSIFVHEGTRYMKSRPFMRMAVEKNEGNVNKFMVEAVDKTLNEIGKKT